MAIKKICQAVLLSICLFNTFPIKAETLAGDNIQIYTHFDNIEGSPTWLLILRDVESGTVMPYLYDIKHEDNFWLALANSHTYQVTASTLQYGPYATINNFCHLEDGVISWKSMYITLRGDLTPNRKTSHCYVKKYRSYPFPIVETSS